MTLDPNDMLSKIRSEWLVMALGLTANVILIAYLGWRLAIINDVVARKEVEFHQIWIVQDELLRNQRAMLANQVDMARIMRPYDQQANPPAKPRPK
jgi:hypothetical protein